MAKIRNDVEHLFLKATSTVAREVLASAMPLIERLMVEHLEEEPLEVFEDTVWQKLLENREIFDTQQARCRDTFKTVAWSGEIFTRALPFLRCPHCSSPLVRCVETENMAFDNLWIKCAECSEEIDREPLFEKAFGDVNDQEAYSVAKDGGMPLVTTCPICNRGSWSRWDRKCVFCYEDRLICELCETECDPQDYNTLDGLCYSCSWGMQKAMRDD